MEKQDLLVLTIAVFDGEDAFEDNIAPNESSRCPIQMVRGEGAKRNQRTKLDQLTHLCKQIIHVKSSRPERLTRPLSRQVGREIERS